MPSLFLDTGFAIALASRKDMFHERATALAEEITATRPRIVTTQAVLIEVGNALSAPPLRVQAAAYIDHLRHDPMIEVIQNTDALFQKSLWLYKERQDKGWGLTDCISFVVMRGEGITEALTADRHFEQAGFKALLRT